jgi:xanthine/uracil/vitamin C permease (AzgA family)
MPTTPKVAADPLVDHSGETEKVTRNLFDLRTIIGGLFTIYGVYLTIYGIVDGPAAIAKAAGVRINLWTGLGMLVVGLIFLAWAFLKPLTLDTAVAGTGDSLNEDREHDKLRDERRRAGGE